MLLQYVVLCNIVRRMMNKRYIILLITLALCACAQQEGDVRQKRLEREEGKIVRSLTGEESRRATRGKLFGGDGLNLFGSDRGTGGMEYVGPNPTLWQAAQDVASLLPISSLDRESGAIITDWYAPPQTPDERFKLNILVRGKKIQANSVRVSVFRQNKSGAGWRDVEVGEGVARALEDKILQRVRELKQGDI